MDIDQEYLGYLQDRQPTPDYGMIFKLLSDAIYTYLGGEGAQEFLQSFDGDDHYKSFLWIFSGNNYDGDITFDDAAMTVYPNRDPDEIRRGLQKQFFSRLEQSLSPDVVAKFEQEVARKFKEMFQLIANIIQGGNGEAKNHDGRARRSHAGRSRVYKRGNGGSASSSWEECFFGGGNGRKLSCKHGK